jgi:hypothetical protein
MRSFVTSVTTLAFLVLASSLALTKPSCAGTVINACGKFSFWVPDDWRAAKQGTGNVERTAFESKDGNLYVLVGSLADKEAVLSDEDVTDFVDEEFDDMKVTSDKKDTVEKMDVRLLEGTGVDEGESVAFKLLALGAGSDDGVLAIVVSGSPKDMARPENQATIDRILRSLRPQQ